MFYDIYAALCKQKGVSESRAAESIGLKRSSVVKWKGGATPSAPTLQRLSEYFGITTDYLLGQETEKAAIDYADDDLKEYLDELRNRPDKRLLFSVTKNATKSQIEAIVKMIEEMQGEN